MGGSRGCGKEGGAGLRAQGKKKVARSAIALIVISHHPVLHGSRSATDMESRVVIDIDSALLL